MRKDYDITIPDMLFPSDNELEIPTLDINMQAENCQIPFLCFGEQKRTYNMKFQFHKGTIKTQGCLFSVPEPFPISIP